MMWSDWDDYRDGMRDPDDRTRIRPRFCYLSGRIEIPRYNKKNRGLLKRRKARRIGRSDNLL